MAKIANIVSLPCIDIDSYYYCYYLCNFVLFDHVLTNYYKIDKNDKIASAPCIDIDSYCY